MIDNIVVSDHKTDDKKGTRYIIGYNIDERVSTSLYYIKNYYLLYHEFSVKSWRYSKIFR